MNKQVTIAVATVFVALYMLAGCGGAGGNENWIADDVRLASLQAVQDAFGALPGDDPDADRASLLAFLQSRPEFEAAGINGRCVWGRYTDGQLLIIANNLLLDGTSEAPAPTSPVPQGRAPTEIPLSGTARFLNVLGTYYPDPMSASTPLSANGYSVVSGESEVTVEGLKNANGSDGVFFINTHGGIGESRTNDVYALATGTTVTPTTQQIYRNDLRQQRLTYFLSYYDEINGEPIEETRFAVTSRFVRRYMSFGRNSIVFANACSSASDGAEDFRTACFSVGASVYAGWTRDVGTNFAKSAVTYFFQHSARFGTESSETYPKIKQDMYNASPRLDLDTGYDNAELLFFPNTTSGSGDFGLLAPQIKTVTADRTAGTLLLVGVFGANPGAEGTVKVGGTPIPVTSWQPYSILCSLPASGLGSSGAVVVTVRGHHSNAGGPIYSEPDCTHENAPPIGELVKYMAGNQYTMPLTRTYGHIYGYVTKTQFARYDSNDDGVIDNNDAVGSTVTGPHSAFIYLISGKYGNDVSEPTSGYSLQVFLDNAPYYAPLQILLSTIDDDGSFSSVPPDSNSNYASNAISPGTTVNGITQMGKFDYSCLDLGDGFGGVNPYTGLSLSLAWRETAADPADPEGLFYVFTQDVVGGPWGGVSPLWQGYDYPYPSWPPPPDSRPFALRSK